jgi:hypothetical protein
MPGWRTQRVSHLGAQLGQDLHHAGREQPLQVIGHRQRRQRRELGRLEDHGVAGHQRRGQLGRGEHQRVVERDDPGHDAERLVHGVVQPSRGFRHGPAAHLERQADQVPDLAGGQADVVAHLMQRAAVVQRVEPGQFLATLGNRIGEGQQRGRAHLGLGHPLRGQPGSAASQSSSPPAGRSSVCHLEGSVIMFGDANDADESRFFGDGHHESESGATTATAAIPAIQPLLDQPLASHRRDIREPPAFELLILDIPVYGRNVAGVRRRQPELDHTVGQRACWRLQDCHVPPPIRPPVALALSLRAGYDRASWRATPRPPGVNKSSRCGPAWVQREPHNSRTRSADARKSKPALDSGATPPEPADARMALKGD